MTPKEEARALVDSYLIYFPQFYNDKEYDYNIEKAKQCALIAVDLHLEELSKMKLIFSDRELHYKRWQEVKQEIKLL
jgi:hypothetical protein